MKIHLWLNIGITITALLVTPVARSKPIDNLAAECDRTGATSLVVRNAQTGDKFIYWCGTSELDHCPGNHCQSDEHIVVEPDCKRFPNDQGCTGNRFPRCEGNSQWDPVKNRCVLACGPNQIETYHNGRWTCTNLSTGSSGGSGSGSGKPNPKPKTCLEAADRYCQRWFAPGNLKDISGECYTTKDCLRKITKAEGEELRSPTATCKLCVHNSCKQLPDGKDFPDDAYCDTSLGIATRRLADFWKKSRELRDKPVREAEKRAECLRDPDLCGRRQHIPPQR